MSFLEIAKLYLANQEKKVPTPGIRILDGRQVERIIWETEKAVIFQDAKGRFWRYLHSYGQTWPAIIVKHPKESV